MLIIFLIIISLREEIVENLVFKKLMLVNIYCVFVTI